MPNPTEEVIEKAVDSLNKDPGEVKPPVEKAPDADSTGDDDPKKDKDPKEEDDAGFLADEIDEDTPPPTVSDKKVEAEKLDTSGLNEEQKYIVDNLPYITARIKEGDHIKEVQVKSWTQLPDDIEFASKRDEIAFVNALTAQENRARELQFKFQQNDQQTKSAEFERLENEAIREDITELQRAGDLPKFKLKPTDKGFADDPATKEVQDVLNYLEERNKQYLAEYNQGRPYRHIGFREAYHMYQRENPKKAEAAREDKERKDMADKVGGNRGLSAKELKKSAVKSGTRISDILDRIDREW